MSIILGENVLKNYIFAKNYFFDIPKYSILTHSYQVSGMILYTVKNRLWLWPYSDE